jgi:hypothetical protein
LIPRVPEPVVCAFATPAKAKADSRVTRVSLFLM